jgi:hypothetical protein
MEWSLENFLGINGIFVILLLLFFWSSRNSSLKPSKLTFAKGSNQSEPKMSQTTTNTKDLALDADENIGERVLNIMFVYNGHSWDAFEVLGLPAGSNLATAQVAHERLILHCDKSSRELYDRALNAIKVKSNNSSSQPKK